MNIFENINVVDSLLKDRKSIYMVGTAGCGKSSVINRLADLGYSSATMLTPTNILKNGHTERFSSNGIELSVHTYSSAIESVKRGKIDYDSDIKHSTLNSDIFILDEIFAVDVRLLKAAIKHAIGLGAPMILLGDEKQTTRHSRESGSVLLGGIDGFEYTESLRGDEVNRNLINGLYAGVQEGEISANKLAELIGNLGGTVKYGLPEANTGRIGYTRNAVSRTLIDLYGNTHALTFNGKVTYTSTGELSKSFREAVCTSQDVKDMISAVTGISVPVGVPSNHWSHITCIGCENDMGNPYHLVLVNGDMLNLSAAYTLLSRQKSVYDLTVHIVNRDDIGDTLYKSYVSLDTKEGVKRVVKTQYYAKSTKEELGIPVDIVNTVITVSSKEMIRLLSLVTIPYFKGTEVIYLDDGVSIRVSFDGDTVEEWVKKSRLTTLDDFLKDNLGVSIEKDSVPEDMTAHVIGEVLRKAPELVCDCTLLNMIGNKAIDVKDLCNARIKYVRDDCNEVNLISDDIDLENVSLPDDITSYILDLKASYWQILAEYSNFIGYGMVVKHNPSMPITYWLCSHDNNVFILNNKLIDMYKSLGVGIIKVFPLASRTGTLSTVIDDDLKEHIHYRRQVSFGKERMNIWGTLMKPRFETAEIVSKSGTEKVIKDNGTKSSLWTAMVDIVSIQNMLTYCIAKHIGGNVKVKADSVFYETNVELPGVLFDVLVTPDVTITETKGYDTISVLDKCDKIVYRLECYVERYCDGKKTNKNDKRKKVIKLREKIGELKGEV